MEKDQGKPKGIADPDFWGKDFENMPWYNVVKEIMTLPGTDDMPGVVARSVLKNPRKRTAIIRLIYRCIKFHDKNHLEMLRLELASTIGEDGLGRLDQLFAATRLLAPGMYRAVKGLPQDKNGDNEKVYRGSDFREKTEMGQPGG